MTREWRYCGLVYNFFLINNIELKCSFVRCRKYHKSWSNGAAELHITLDLLCGTTAAELHNNYTYIDSSFNLSTILFKWSTVHRSFLWVLSKDFFIIITKLFLEWNFKNIHPKLQHDQIFHVIYFSPFTIRPFNTPRMHVRGDEAGSIFKHDTSVSVIFFTVIKKAVFVNVPLIFLSWLLVKIFFLVLFRFFLVVHVLVNLRSTQKDWFVGYYPRLYYSLEFNLNISLQAQTFEKWAPAQSVYI